MKNGSQYSIDVDDGFLSERDVSHLLSNLFSRVKYVFQIAESLEALKSHFRDELCFE
jgi:hypothetical protein